MLGNVACGGSIVRSVDSIDDPFTHTHPNPITPHDQNNKKQNRSHGSGGNKDNNELKSKLPYPKIGDVVQYPGKWEGERGIGQIRFLQRIQ